VPPLICLPASCGPPRKTGEKKAGRNVDAPSPRPYGGPKDGKGEGQLFPIRLLQPIGDFSRHGWAAKKFEFFLSTPLCTPPILLSSYPKRRQTVEWKAETERVVLMRLVATLFALADLADRVSLAPYPVRCHVLAILRPVEAVVQALAIGMARGAPMPPQAFLMIGAQIGVPDGDDRGDDPLDATHLALSLRVLALTLARLAAQSECVAGHALGLTAAAIKIDAEICQLRKLVQLAVHRTQQRAPPPDTS
jgi:hypothetical protein